MKKNMSGVLAVLLTGLASSASAWASLGQPDVPRKPIFQAVILMQAGQPICISSDPDHDVIVPKFLAPKPRGQGPKDGPPSLPTCKGAQMTLLKELTQLVNNGNRVAQVAGALSPQVACGFVRHSMFSAVCSVGDIDLAYVLQQY